MKELLDFYFIEFFLFLFFLSYLTGTFVLRGYIYDKIDLIEYRHTDNFFNANIQYRIHKIFSIAFYILLSLFSGLNFGILVGLYCLIILTAIVIIIRSIIYKIKIISITYNYKGPIKIEFSNNIFSILLSPFSNNFISFIILMLLIWYIFYNWGIIKV
jgi:hypothetical protein